MSSRWTKDESRTCFCWNTLSLAQRWMQLMWKEQQQCSQFQMGSFFRMEPMQMRQELRPRFIEARIASPVRSRLAPSSEYDWKTFSRISLTRSSSASAASSSPEESSDESGAWIDCCFSRYFCKFA